MRVTLLVSLAISSSRGFPIIGEAFARSRNNSWDTRKSSIIRRLSGTAGSSDQTTIMDQGYGSWQSPITSKAITAGSVGIGSLNYDNDGGKLYWVEARPQEAGRYVLCRYAPEDPNKNERNAIDVSPKESNVRTRVHEYGGGAVTIGGANSIFYSEFTTQRLCQLILSGKAESVVRPLTPDTETPNMYRFADGDFVASSNSIYCIRENHENPAPKDVVNEIVSIQVPGKDGDTADGTSSDNVRIVATGNDFYAAPRVSPDGTKLAYITWNHPNMPWDATQLRIVSLGGKDDEHAGSSTSDHMLVAGSDGETSVIQPLWHPISGDLYYISDESGYYNIYRATFGVDGKVQTSRILPMDYDFGGSAPGWSLGQQGFSFLPKDGRLLATYSKNGVSRLVVVDVMNTNEDANSNFQEYSGGEEGSVLPMQFGGVIGTDSNELYFMGGSPSTPSSVYRWNLDSPDQPAEVLACSSTLSFPDSVISVPKQIEFPTTLGTAYGYYYAPRNADYACTTEPAPPLLVKAHGGPTSCTGTTLNAAIQYWTSRGFAVLDVDYGGSTGYGRDYRRRLRSSWGIVDVDDVCAGAQFCVQQGLADPKRLCIDGGSAGGYTTLCALTYKDVFLAGEFDHLRSSKLEVKIVINQLIRSRITRFFFCLQLI